MRRLRQHRRSEWSFCVFAGVRPISNYTPSSDPRNLDGTNDHHAHYGNEDHRRMNPKRLFRTGCSGQSLVEFTFVGIPMIFVLIGTFEISRGMWMYHTLAHAVRDGVRYASVHG